MKLTQEELDAIRIECKNYKDIRAAAVEALKIVQKNQGWVSDNSISLVAKLLNISVSDLEGIATFYNQIFRQPVGHNIIRYCDSIVCYIHGCEKICKDLEFILGIQVGGTTCDKKFTLLPACCLGMCDKSPVVMINDDLHCYVDSTKLHQLLGLYK